LISWPVSISKALRTKVVVGKSLPFMVIVCLGYLSGVIHKALYSLDWIIALDAVNFVLVALDLFLYGLYCRRHKNEFAHNT